MYRSGMLLVLGLLILFSSSDAENKVTVRLDAIRVLDKARPQLNMSVWLYDAKGEVVTKASVPGRLNPKDNLNEWVKFPASTGSAVPGGIILDVLSGDGAHEFRTVFRFRCQETPASSSTESGTES